MFDTRVKDRALKRNAQILLSSSGLSSKKRLASSALQAGVARASRPQAVLKRHALERMFGTRFDRRLIACQSK